VIVGGLVSFGTGGNVDVGCWWKCWRKVLVENPKENSM